MKASSRSGYRPSRAARTEFAWLAMALVGGAVVGALVSHPYAGALLAVLGYAIWLICRLDVVLAWQRSGAHVATAPPTAGLTEQAVALIHRMRKQGRKQKNRFKRALDQFNTLAAEMPDATVVLDEQRQIRWANAAAKRLLGIDGERDKGQRIDNLLRGPDFQAFLSADDASSDHEIAAPVAPELTLALRKASAGNKFVLVIARDITQRVRVREMRKAFVGDVSHELRTPLTVIGGYLEVLGDDRTLPIPVQQAIRNVTDQSERMRLLVEHLLELSQLEGNPLDEDEGERVALSALVRDVVAAQQRTAVDTPHRPHAFELALDESLLLRGAEPELYSVCQNLIGNAVRHTAPGTAVDISWQRAATGEAVFEVTDHGQGVDQRHLPRLSERFYRVDPGRARASGGTGLGLAIVKHVAQRHGGSLEIASTPGQGSTFRVIFPEHRALVVATALDG